MVDKDLPYLTYPFGIAGEAGKSNLGINFGYVKLQDLRIVGIIIACIKPVPPLGPGPDILLCGAIWGKNTVLGPGLYSHIGHGEPAGHGEVINGVPDKFHGLIKGPVYTNLPNSIQNQILPTHPGFQFSPVD